jgi:ribosomal protein S13
MFTIDIKAKKKWLIALTFIVLLGVYLLLSYNKSNTVSVEPILDDVQDIRERLTDLSENTRENIRKEVKKHEVEIKEDIRDLPDSTIVDRLNAFIEE